MDYKEKMTSPLAFTIRYYRADRGCSLEDAYIYKTNYLIEMPSDIAEECAEDYHYNHDGWEAKWPLKLTIFYEDKRLGTFDIEREARPAFVAYPVKEDGKEDLDPKSNKSNLPQRTTR